MDTVTSSHDRHAYLPGRPETMFAVDGVVAAGAGFRGFMSSGPWSSGPPNAAAIGVLADNVLGYALIAEAPVGWWSVSTEISLDFLRPLPSDGTRMTAEGRVVHAAPGTGLAEGAVFAADGEAVARCRQWGRYVEAGPARDTDNTPDLGACRSVTELADNLLAGAAAVGGRAWLSLPIDEDLVNPLRTLHGGITLWLTEFLAHRAVGSVAENLLPASLNVSYLRPLRQGDLATFRAEVTSCGRRLAVTRVTAADEAGKLCVVASAHHHGPH
jgi:uncharacterized protein (TIGR00369 family)